MYADPSYDSNDNLLGTLKKTGGPVDVSGGWFDAGGGYEKFAYTASYADALHADRGAGLSKAGPELPALLEPEADFGLQWITKLWNPATKVLYVQVGIGNGNASNTIQGDYNFWFLPQAEDQLNVSKGGNPGPTAYYVKYRPVFAAAPPGKQVSPDLAGRFAADFALGAQLRRRLGRRRRARHLLALARSVYAMAKTTDVGKSSPRSRTTTTRAPSGRATCCGARPRSRWPTRRPAPRPAAAPGPGDRGHWARAYIAQGHPASGDTFNLYDNGAVAEAELLQAMRRCRGSAGDRAGRAAGRHGRAAAHGRGAGRRATRSGSAPSWAARTPHRTRSGCTSPTRCTSSTAVLTGTRRSRSSS